MRRWGWPGPSTGKQPEPSGPPRRFVGLRRRCFGLLLPSRPQLLLPLGSRLRQAACLVLADAVGGGVVEQMQAKTTPTVEKDTLRRAVLAVQGWRLQLPRLPWRGPLGRV